MILRGEQIAGVTMDADGLKAAGSSVGTAGLIVMDEDTDLIRVIRGSPTSTITNRAASAPRAAKGRDGCRRS